MNEERWTSSALHSPDISRFRSEDEPRLQLEHSRRVNVCESRERVRYDSVADRNYRHGHQLTERRVRYSRVAENRLSASEEVPVVEYIEALQPEQEARAL